MKRIASLLLPLCALTANAQDIKLPAPNMQRSTLNMMETLATRHSVREYADRQLSAQDLSDLCWAACGQARDDKHITAPSAMNRQEVRLFVFTQTGVYEYNAAENRLVENVKGDHRSFVAGGKGFSQDFVLSAPVSLVMVIDFKRFGSNDQRALMMGCVDAGNVSENVNLYCQAAGLCTVPRATMDVDGIRALLGFTEEQLPIMNNPVGYPKQ